MSDKKKARGSHCEFPMHDDMCVAGTVSSGDCTGMIPSGSIDSAEEYEQSNELHKYGAYCPTRAAVRRTRAVFADGAGATRPRPAAGQALHP